MQGFRLSVTEQLCLFLTSVGLLWISDQSPPDIIRASKARQMAMPHKEVYTERPSHFDARPNQNGSAQIYQIYQTESPNVIDKPIPINRQSIDLPAGVSAGWSYTLQFKVISPLPLQGGFANYAEKIDETSAVFELESPHHLRWGSLQIRSQVPLHRLWQTDWKTDMTGYPQEIDRSPIQAAYHSNLYLRWAIPAAQSRNFNGSYLQIGSIQPRSDSLWYTLRSTSSFPGSKEALAALPMRAKLPGQGGASTKYQSQSGLGQNIGLSWDGQFLQVLLLHQRSIREEHLSTGLALRFDRLPPIEPIALSGLQKTNNLAQNTYRLRVAALLSQNLSKADSSSNWYQNHTQQRQNASLYQASAEQRWPELLRYDRAVKQFYLQAGWKHSFQPKYVSQKRSSYFQLGTEQGASVSPLDYWGNLQRYYFQFQFPVFEQPVKQAVLSNAFYATYSDAHWVDARRRLASSTVSQRYGRRLNLQNQFKLYFQQKPVNPTDKAGPPNRASRSSKLRQQVLRLDNGVKTIGLFHSSQTSYWNFSLNYYWLWYRSNQSFRNVWHLMLGANLQQPLFTATDIRPELTQFPTTLWLGEAKNSFGWQQQPPTRKPLVATGIPSVSRFGWKIMLKGKGDEHAAKQGSLALRLFFQVWHYGSRQQSTGWWKFFQIQWDLRLSLEQLEQAAYWTFQTRLQARLQLRLHWSMLLAVKLNELRQTLDAPVRLPESLQLELRFRYEFQHIQPSSATSIDLDKDPLEELSKPFELDDNQTS